MQKENLLLDLRQAGLVWNHKEADLAENIVSPSGEALESVTLPNASLCADFLVDSNDVWVGVAVGVIEADIPLVFEAFQLANPSFVRRILPKQAANLERYRPYSGRGWIEVIWTDANQIKLVEVLTNGVLWYALSQTNYKASKVVVMGLENLERLAIEPSQPLKIPQALIQN